MILLPELKLKIKAFLLIKRDYIVQKKNTHTHSL